MSQLKILKCNDQTQWELAKYFRQKYFFGLNNIEDPYQWTFTHPSHEHFVLYNDTKIIGYAHIQLWGYLRAALRIIVIEEVQRNKNFGSKFLQLCEEHLKKQGYKTLHAESNPIALDFYMKNGYVELPFDDPDGFESDPNDTALAKNL
jgi:GNAT superfamily N-acetyltransferase